MWTVSDSPESGLCFPGSAGHKETAGTLGEAGGRLPSTHALEISVTSSRIPEPHEDARPGAYYLEDSFQVLTSHIIPQKAACIFKLLCLQRRGVGLLEPRRPHCRTRGRGIRELPRLPRACVCHELIQMPGHSVAAAG